MLHDILEHHASELAFVWSARDAAARGSNIDLVKLGDFDERVEANVDGLRIAGDAGIAVALAALEGGDPGVAFAAALLAIERGDTASLGIVLDLAVDPAIARGVISAFGWADERAAIAAAEPLRAAPRAHLRAIAIAAFGAHRRDPGGAVTNALLDHEPTVRARALRAAGEIGRVDLLPDLSRALTDPDEACRFWAARSIALLGEPAPSVLWAFIEQDAYAMRAMEVAVRRTDPREAAGRIESLSARAEHARVAIFGAGALGDPGAISWLLARMNDEALARIAADAMTMITGVAVEGDLAAKAPAKRVAGPNDDPRDTNVAMDPDADLPWPSKDALTIALRSRAADLRRGHRYLLGQPITEGLTTRVLESGYQPQRAAAAIERTRFSPGRALFEVRAPAFRQKVG